MKIILVGLTHPFRGGISHFTTSLYHALSDAHDVKLISFSKLYPRILFPGKSQLDSTQSSFKTPNHLKINSLNPLTWIKTLPLIKRERPDLILFMWWNPILTFAYVSIAYFFRLLAGSRIVYYCHNIFPHEESLAGRLLTRFALRAADIFLCQSTQDARLVQNLFPDKHAIKVSHPTYDIFPKKNISKSEAQKRLGISSPTLLFFGHVRKYKGLEILLHSLPEVLKEIDCTLVIAGEFYEPRQKFMKIISDHDLRDKVMITDCYIENDRVEIYFSAADAVVLPYVSAANSGVIPLAFHFNAPVIAAETGGLQDMVEHRKTGFLAPPNDSGKLASAILEFFREKESIDFENNIKTSKKKNSWQSLIYEIEGCCLPNPKNQNQWKN